VNSMSIPKPYAADGRRVGGTAIQRVSKPAS
jgi:hypothetical protein